MTKIAMKYGAGGKSLARVIEDNPDKNAEPEKIFNAWASGENMRYSGESKRFLEEVENQEIKQLKKASLLNTKTEYSDLPKETESVIMDKTLKQWCYLETFLNIF